MSGSSGNADAMFATDAEGRVIFMSPAAEAITGCSREEAEGRPSCETLQIEEALRRSRKRLEITYERVPVSIADTDLDGRFLRVNRHFCEFTGYSHEELLARSYPDITHPEDIQDDMDRLARLLAGEIPCSRIEKRYIGRDARSIWVRFTGCLVRSRGEATDFAIGIVQDTTDRRRAEVDLCRAREDLEARVETRSAELAWANRHLREEAAEQRRTEEAMSQADRTLRALLRASPLAIVTLDAGGKVTAWNPAAGPMFGWAESDVLGLPLPTLPGDLGARDPSGCKMPGYGDFLLRVAVWSAGVSPAPVRPGRPRSVRGKRKSL